MGNTTTVTQHPSSPSIRVPLSSAWTKATPKAPMLQLHPPAHGKGAATLKPDLGPALKTHPSCSPGHPPGPEAWGPQAEHGHAKVFYPVRTALPSLFTPPEFQYLRHKTVREVCVSPAQPKRAVRSLTNNTESAAKMPWACAVES